MIRDRNHLFLQKKKEWKKKEAYGMKVLTYMQGGHKAVGILTKNGQEVVPVR